MKYIGFNYYATKEGEIYSSVKGSFLNKRVSAHGYYLVNLSIEGKCKTFSVHRLIATAFIEHDASFNVVNHLDGNKLNNNVSNLEWTTHKGNYKHAKEHGLIKPAVGMRTRFGRFSTDQIKQIRFSLETLGCSQYQLAKEYNVTRSAIEFIAQRKTYKHIS